MRSLRGVDTTMVAGNPLKVSTPLDTTMVMSRGDGGCGHDPTYYVGTHDACTPQGVGLAWLRQTPNPPGSSTLARHTEPQEKREA